MIALMFTIALTVGPTDLNTRMDEVEQPFMSVPMKAEEVPVLTGVAVTVECTAHADGRVTNCSVLGETHPGLGFGEAAVALVQDSRVEPGTRDVQFARTIQFTP